MGGVLFGRIGERVLEWDGYEGRRGEEEGKCGESVVIFGDLGRKGGVYHKVPPMLDLKAQQSLVGPYCGPHFSGRRKR